jgi:hypothetical protein
VKRNPKFQITFLSALEKEGELRATVLLWLGERPLHREPPCADKKLIVRHAPCNLEPRVEPNRAGLEPLLQRIEGVLSGIVFRRKLEQCAFPLGAQPHNVADFEHLLGRGLDDGDVAAAVVGSTVVVPTGVVAVCIAAVANSDCNTAILREPALDLLGAPSDLGCPARATLGLARKHPARVAQLSAAAAELRSMRKKPRKERSPLLVHARKLCSKDPLQWVTSSRRLRLLLLLLVLLLLLLVVRVVLVLLVQVLLVLMRFGLRPVLLASWSLGLL